MLCTHAFRDFINIYVSVYLSGVYSHLLASLKFWSMASATCEQIKRKIFCNYREGNWWQKKMHSNSIWSEYEWIENEMAHILSHIARKIKHMHSAHARTHGMHIFVWIRKDTRTERKWKTRRRRGRGRKRVMNKVLSFSLVFCRTNNHQLKILSTCTRME